MVSSNSWSREGASEETDRWIRGEDGQWIKTQSAVPVETAKKEPVWGYQEDSSNAWQYNNNYKTKIYVDWEQVIPTLPAFEKDFYVPHPDVENRSEEEVAAILAKNKIHIIPSDNVVKADWDDSRWGSANQDETKTPENPSSNDRPVPKPVTNMIEASFPEYITEKLCDQLGGPLVEPTAVQKLLWPIALSGRDCVAIAPTGTGKTLGYLLPAIVHITAQEPVRPTDLSPIGLVIVPTRELAQQVMEQATMFGSSITDLGFEALRPVCLYGGTKRDVQRGELAAKHPDLVVATPGRLIDFLSDGTLNLSRVTYFVVDEVDRLIAIDGKQRLQSNGFVEDMKYVSSLIRPGRQCVMCSATCTSDVLDLARALCGSEPVFFQVAETDKVERLVVNSNIEQHFAVAGDFEEDRLRFLMDNVLPSTFTETLGRVEQKMMIFVNAKDRVDRVTEALRAAGWPAIGFHGDKDQWERDWIFENFKTGVCNILVATDVMGRGMDFEDVRAVVNFELPDTIESYVHRVGRTGRFGKKILKGYALSFLTKRDWFILPGLEQLLGDSGLEVPDILAERIAEFRTYQEKSTTRW